MPTPTSCTKTYTHTYKHTHTYTHTHIHTHRHTHTHRYTYIQPCWPLRLLEATYHMHAHSNLLYRDMNKTAHQTWHHDYNVYRSCTYLQNKHSIQAYIIWPTKITNISDLRKLQTCIIRHKKITNISDLRKLQTYIIWPK